MKNKALENLCKRKDKGHPSDEDFHLKIKVSYTPYKKGKKVSKSAFFKLSCGDCDNKLSIYLPETYSNLKSDDFIEIGGVIGRIEEWREILLPILNIDYTANSKKKGQYLKLRNS